MLQATAFASSLWSVAFVLLVAIVLQTSVARAPDVTLCCQPDIDRPHTVSPIPHVSSGWVRPRSGPIDPHALVRPVPVAPVAPIDPGPPALIDDVPNGDASDVPATSDGPARDAISVAEFPSRTDPIIADVLPEVVAPARPEYPSLAREAGVEGRVVVAVLVDRIGHVHDTVVERSVPMLDASALAAARRYRFTPALANGHPVAVWVRIPFDFRLH
ncbi:MAG TPA: energy transducer TonB [Candidatus Saccharimonadaceae bacterium]|jgi:protein TonB|nr:energy transducer TonB [Candidatus Saccharimonadaceae bacterium]